MSLFSNLHPAVPVTAGCIFILLVQQIRWPLQMACLLVLFVFCLVFARKEWLRVMRRLKYLIAVVLILFAWQTPGELVWPLLGSFSPSADGCRLAAESASRILSVASAVAVMLHFLTPRDWVRGLYTLAFPLKYLGASPDRFAVRLQLVLSEATAAEKRPWRYWLDDTAVMTPNAGRWHSESLRVRDQVALWMLVLLYAGWMLW